jgi:competence protein ComEC
MEPVGDGAIRVTTDISARGLRSGAPAEAGEAPLSTPAGADHRLAKRLARWIAAERAEARAQLGRAFLWSPAAFGGGCAVYFALKLEPPLWLGLLAAAVGLGVWFAVRRAHLGAGVRFAVALVALFGCGFLAAELRTANVKAPIVWQRTTGQVEGWVVDVASPGAGGGRLMIAPYAIQGLERGQLPARIRVTVGPQGLIGPGQAVRLRAILGPPPDPASPGAYDFARDAFFDRVGGVGFSLTEPTMVQGPRPPPLLGFAMAINAARWALARRMIDDMGPRTGGVAVAMTTGHEAWLDRDEVAAMRNAGISHILSISGVHMAIVGGFVFFLTRIVIALWPWAAVRAPGKKVAAAAGLIATAAYLVLSGAPAPAVRSAVTLSVAFVAVLADRRAISLHALAAAALIVLAMQPEAVIQPGFQMSFAATASLVALAQAWPRSVREISAPWPIRLVQRAGTWLLAALAASFVAGAATGPFAIQHFNRVALYGLPANLATEPLSALLIMPALAGGALLEAFGVGGWLLSVAGFGVDLMLKLADVAAALPGAVMVVSSAPAAAMPIAFLGIIWVCVWKGRLRWLGLPAALAVSLWPRPPAPVAWIAPDGAQAAVVDHGMALRLRPGMKAFAADLWERRRGLAEPKDADEALKARFACDRLKCAPLTAAPPRIAAWWTRRAPKPEIAARLCAGADILIWRREGPAPSCPGARVLTLTDFARGGSTEIYAAKSGWRFVWANDLRGRRPWTAPPR